MSLFGHNRLLLASAAACIAIVAGRVPGSVTIIGGLGNFDVYNNDHDDCNEFEFELEGPHVEDVYHTYRNGNYGSPTITALPGNVGIRVRYANPHHTTRRGMIEHFGVSFSGRNLVTAQRFRWIPGTVVGPNDPPPPPPPPPLALPNVRVEVINTPTGPVVRETVENVDPLGRLMWVQRVETNAAREVALEELMTNDPLITGGNRLDIEELFAGAPLITEEPAPGPGDTDSAVISYEVYSNVPQLIGGSWEDAPGPMIANLITAQVTFGSTCTQALLPAVISQPQSTSGVFDGSADFSTTVDAPPGGGQLIYQWQHEGVDLEGEDQPNLHIDPVDLASAGAYTCLLTNDCGFVKSLSAMLAVEVPIAIDTEPESTAARSGRQARFVVVADTMIAPEYTWYHNGVAITPDAHFAPSPGSMGMSNTLTIHGVTAADGGIYSAVLSNAFTSASSIDVTLTVECPADFNGDQVKDFFDYLDFVDAFAGGARSSDFNHDNVIDFFDYLDFVDSFSGGC